MFKLLIFVIFKILMHGCVNSHHQDKKEFSETSGISTKWPSNDECVQRIYRGCNQPTHFTEEELENVRQYLNYSFTLLADVKPDVPLCPKLYVRQDWKCLTNAQKHRVTNIILELYERGVVQYLEDLHVRYWPAWHKTSVFQLAHRWLIKEFETYMRKIDPNVTLPYWEPGVYSSQPERASIWDFLGHSGNYSNGYCVTDGIYRDIIPCVKRHWSPRGTIYPWTSLEFNAYLIQKSPTYGDIILKILGSHFQPHLNIGGYEGQYSVRSAPYDPLFFIHHNALNDNVVLKWQLSNKQHLTPLSYDYTFAYNNTNGNVEQSNILVDTIIGSPGVPIKQMFWVGFGDLCYIPDSLVKPINRLMKGQSDPIPTAVKRMPEWIVAKYFPAFLEGNTSSLFHTFEEVGECNRECLPIPKPTYFAETENGRRQYRAYAYDNYHDMTGQVQVAEGDNYRFWEDMNQSGYCSPYVTTY